LLFGSVAFLTEATALLCSAQTNQPPTIRVETREVVFPVVVLEERKDPKGLLVGPDGEEFPGWIYKTQEVTGLSARSFRLFEDGVEQRIQHFSIEARDTWLVTDNLGRELEDSRTPTGVWSAPVDKRFVETRSPLHAYLISYIPPPSPAGSCHQIEVKVAKKHATILAPDQYCNTKDPLSDPLNGRDAGNALLQYANSQRPSSIPLALQLTAFSGPSGASRISVAVEVPPDLLKREWKANQLLLSVALLGLVYDKNRRLVTRFSDAACPSPECRDWYDGPVPVGNASIPPLRDAQKGLEGLAVPRSYRTQLELEPGDYQIELVITDGEKFGRAEASVSVDDFRKSGLAISGIALCKRYHTPTADEKGPTRAPQYVPLMFDGREFTPAGDTDFKRGEPLMSYLEIYNNSQTDKAAPPKLYLEMKVTDTKTGELKIGTGLRPVESASPSGNRAIPVVWSLAVDKLPAGTYRLEAQATDSAGHKTEWRETSFRVE
jgi:hypothetical protein